MTTTTTTIPLQLLCPRRLLIDESYTDDSYAAVEHVAPVDIAEDLASAAKELSDKASGLGLALSAPKSTVTLFTPRIKESRRLPPVELDGVAIPQDNNSKLLGVVVDPTFTFSAHAAQVARKASSRLNILGDTSFGHDKECLTITITFKSLIRPLFDFAATIVFTQPPLSVVCR